MLIFALTYYEHAQWTFQFSSVTITVIINTSLSSSLLLQALTRHHHHKYSVTSTTVTNTPLQLHLYFKSSCGSCSSVATTMVSHMTDLSLIPITHASLMVPVNTAA